MLACLGTAQAWSVYVKPLQSEYGLSMWQAQLVFGTSVFVFCTWILVAGRLQDRLGPRLVSLAGAVLVGVAYAITYFGGEHYFFLWLGMGLVYGVACATAYTCPIATAIKWFPDHRGLVAGLTTAAFACGPIIVQAIAQPLLTRGWRVLSVIGLIGSIYTPTLVLTALLLSTPPESAQQRQSVADFRFGSILKDARVWLLFAGMLCGTFPYLLVMGNVRLIAEEWQLPGVIALGVPTMAAANTLGRIFWGHLLDKFGTIPTMRASQILLLVSVAGLALAQSHPYLFLVSAAGIGLGYASNFAIYPGTIAKTYGSSLLGSIFPLVMFAQGISALGPVVGGKLSDLTHSYMPGVALSGCVVLAGAALCHSMRKCFETPVEPKAIFNSSEEQPGVTA
jgi:OFA family oxalate/formate antiporter-like MFS transporter